MQNYNTLKQQVNVINIFTTAIPIMPKPDLTSRSRLGLGGGE